MYLACAWMPYSHMRMVLSSASAGLACRENSESEGRNRAWQTWHGIYGGSGRCHTRGGHEAPVLVDEGNCVDSCQMVIIHLHSAQCRA